jgi:hypothetical protein
MERWREVQLLAECLQVGDGAGLCLTNADGIDGHVAQWTTPVATRLFGI